MLPLSPLIIFIADSCLLARRAIFDGDCAAAISPLIIIAAIRHTPSLRH